MLDLGQLSTLPRSTRGSRNCLQFSFGCLCILPVYFSFSNCIDWLVVGDWVVLAGIGVAVFFLIGKWVRWVCIMVALHSDWLPGTAMYESSLEHDLISINDSSPTYVPGAGSSPSNIDLILCPLAMFSFAKVEVIDDPFGSNHLPVVLELETVVSAASRPTSRINTGDVAWPRFHELLKADLPRLQGSLESGVRPMAVYDEFVRIVREHLLGCGAVRRDDSASKRRPQPLWWSKECEDKIGERRKSYKDYYREQTAEKKAEFKKIDSEVKIFLRRQKRSSFRLFCESMDPSQGMSMIWGTLRALTSRAGALRTNVITDLNSDEFEKLRTDLVREEVPPTDIPLRVIEATVDQLDEPFPPKGV